MATLMAGAIVLGTGSSWVMGFVPFFTALLTAIMLGIGVALSRGVPIGDLPWPGFTLLVTAQLAYGLGLLAQFGLSRLKALRRRRVGVAASPLTRHERKVRDDKAVEPIHNQLR